MKIRVLTDTVTLVIYIRTILRVIRDVGIHMRACQVEHMNFVTGLFRKKSE
jgi:hypothetical protein